MKFGFDGFPVCLKYYDFYVFIISLLIIIFAYIFGSIFVFQLFHCFKVKIKFF